MVSFDSRNRVSDQLLRKLPICFFPSSSDELPRTSSMLTQRIDDFTQATNLRLLKVTYDRAWEGRGKKKEKESV